MFVINIKISKSSVLVFSGSLLLYGGLGNAPVTTHATGRRWSSIQSPNMTNASARSSPSMLCWMAGSAARNRQHHEHLRCAGNCDLRSGEPRFERNPGRRTSTKIWVLRQSFIPPAAGKRRWRAIRSWSGTPRQGSDRVRTRWRLNCAAACTLRSCPRTGAMSTSLARRRVNGRIGRTRRVSVPGQGGRFVPAPSANEYRWASTPWADLSGPIPVDRYVRRDDDGWTCS